jgi:hypothetical protein
LGADQQDELQVDTEDLQQAANGPRPDRGRHPPGYRAGAAGPSRRRAERRAEVAISMDDEFIRELGRGRPQRAAPMRPGPSC